MTPTLDIDSLTDGWIKSYCRTLLQRADEIRSSLIAGYGLPPYLDDIEVFIARDVELNASAHCNHRSAAIGINFGTVTALRLLFDRLLSGDLVFPKLAAGGGERVRYRLSPNGCSVPPDA